MKGPGEPAAENASFPLYPSRSKAQERVYTDAPVSGSCNSTRTWAD